MSFFKKTRERFQLIKLKITRIATVDNPDNPEAQIMMYKRKEPDVDVEAILRKWKRIEQEKDEEIEMATLSDFEKKVQQIALATIRRYPEGRAQITGALREAGFPTSVLPSATEVAKAAGEITYTKSDVESLMSSLDDKSFTSVNRLLYATREDALPDPKPEPAPEVRKAWADTRMQERASLALDVLSAEIYQGYSKVPRYPTDGGPSKAQAYMKACDTPLGQQLYKAMTARGEVTPDEWLKSQTPSPELVEVAKLLKGRF